MKEFISLPKHPRYEINMDGIIRNAKTKAIKSQYVGSTGYYMISFSYHNKSHPHRVHRLLAITYIPNPENKAQINHINGNKLDYNLSNLEWCTEQENKKHAFDIGLINNTGENNGMSILKEYQVKRIKRLLLDGLTQQSIADKYGVSRSCILGIKINRL